MPSCSQSTRRKLQCPNDTSCSTSRTCNARTSARVASFTRCARRSFGTASRQWRKMSWVGWSSRCLIVCRLSPSGGRRRPQFHLVVEGYFLPLARRLQDRGAHLEGGQAPRAVVARRDHVVDRAVELVDHLRPRH